MGCNLGVAVIEQAEQMGHAFVSFENESVLLSAARQFNDREISRLVLKGVGVHSAEVASALSTWMLSLLGLPLLLQMSSQDRSSMERLFLGRALAVLFTTSTLAVGVCGCAIERSSMPYHCGFFMFLWYEQACDAR